MSIRSYHKIIQKCWALYMHLEALKFVLILSDICYTERTRWCPCIEWLGVPVSSVQSLSHVYLFATPWNTNSWSLLKFMSIKSVMPSNHLILCCPVLFPSSIFPSIRVFSNESILCIMWPEYWSFSFSISPSNEYSALISFRIDWFDLLAVQGTLKSLLQHYSSKASSALKKALSLLYGPTLTSIHDY